MDATANGHEHDNLVRDGFGCPDCGERDADQLHWLDDERVGRQRCGRIYRPEAGDDD